MEHVTQSFVFHNAISEAAAGEIFEVGKHKTLSVSIRGTATSRTVQFYALNEIGEDIPINGYNISTGVLAVSTSGINSEIWVFDVSGIERIKMNISTISGGNLMVKGKAVS